MKSQVILNVQPPQFLRKCDAPVQLSGPAEPGVQGVQLHTHFLGLSFHLVNTIYLNPIHHLIFY